MFESKYSKVLTVILVIVIIAIIALLYQKSPQASWWQTSHRTVSICQCVNPLNRMAPSWSVR